MSSGLVTSRRNRRTPYTERVESLGVSGFSIVNHTLLPKSFARSVEEDYWHLKEHVQLWDVGCQRQVELRGPDAALDFHVGIDTASSLEQSRISS